MSKYIDREAFKSKYLCCGYLPEMSEDEFDKFPAADVVEVVRCGNCKSSEPIPENSGFYKGNWLHCRKWRGEFTENVWHPKEKRWKDWSVTTPEGFCDDGEARDENKEDG